MVHVRAVLLSSVFAVPLVSCSAEVTAESPLERARARGLAYLVAQQGVDGGWRSEPYAVLRPGYSLTATILYTMSRVPVEVGAKAADTIEQAFAFLHRGTDKQGGVGLEGSLVDYPGYTSAFYLLALNSLRPPGWQDRSRLQVDRLRQLQLVEARGWEPGDVQYGGFSSGGRSVQKPLGADLLNLSVTTAVLEALRAAGVPPEDEIFRKALVFVKRCQLFDSDGGFVFTTHPEFTRSKAGFERLSDGTERPRSYGSTTFDGIRALLACGLTPSDPRVQAALAWVGDRFTVDETPGFTAEDHAQEEALRLYYYASLAVVLDQLQVDWAWREALTEKLLELQRADGSWVGLSDLMKEDDPLVATPLAMMALERAMTP